MGSKASRFALSKRSEDRRGSVWWVWLGRIGVLLALVVAVFDPIQATQAANSLPSAADLIAAVNGLRASKGLPALQTNSALMAAAQGHSEYQASIHTATHSGADGSTPGLRAAAAGYQSGTVIENIAAVRVGTDVSVVVYNIWSDALHWNTMVNPAGVDVGAGMAESNGLVYYTLDVGMNYGHAAQGATNPGITRPKDTPDASQFMVPVVTSTPNPDGSVSHQVQQGQSPWAIAIAYGVHIADLVSLNHLAPTPVLQVGQILLVRRGSASVQGTPSPEVTERTASIPVESPTPTDTAPPSPTDTPAATPRPRPSVTPTPVPPPSLAMRAMGAVDDNVLGAALVLVSGLGLVSVLLEARRPK